MRRTLSIIVLGLACAASTVEAARRTSILESPHNLSISGRGEIKSLSETRVCIFCHSSHNAAKDGPLWNHVTTAPEKFRTYDRSTLSSDPGQPNGASKLCLSCHDGTVAVGAVRSMSGIIPMRNVGGGGEIPAERRSHLGTDLSGTHPVSVRFEQDLALKSGHLRWPPIDPDKQVATDADGYVQCTSCHDPHGSRSERYPFWRKESFSEVCKVCHEL